jgi:hypothetical protein
MKIESIMIIILLFSLVVTVFMGVATDLAVQYTNMGTPIALDNSTSALFDQSQAINNQTQKLQTALSSSPNNAIEVINSFLYGAWSALLMTFDTLALATSQVIAAAAILGLPPAITGFVIVAISLTLIFTLIYIAFRVGSYL